MKISGNDIRIGYVLNLNDKLWAVHKTQHTQPGKGGAYMQVEMKNIIDGTKLNHRFRSSETVEKVFLEEVKYQYLYSDENNYIFMEPETYEQVLIAKNLLGDSALFLQDNMMVNICFYEDKPISVKLPETVVMEVIEAEPVVKGQTASSSYKPAKLGNGLRIMVPPHIEAGTKVIVNTVDSSYVEKAKE